MSLEHRDGMFLRKTSSGEARLLYHIEGNTMSVYSTYVPPQDRGKGIAEQMTLAAFDFAKKNNLKVRPDCSYTRYFLERHKEFRKYSIW